MAQLPLDDKREYRIKTEAVVEENSPAEQAMDWCYYLEDRLTFPFTAECQQERKGYPLRPGEQVQVLQMAAVDECMQEMCVEIERGEQVLVVPLVLLKPVAADPTTQEAVADWHYWVGRGYHF